jgi:spermidine/putrescine-binding protein
MLGFAAANGKTLDFVIPEEGAMVFMDTLAVPRGRPTPTLAYKMLSQSISPDGQKHIADALTQAVITEAAVPLVDERNRSIYRYGELEALFEKARFYPLWPLEPEGDFVTHDQTQEEYQRFLQA